MMQPHITAQLCKALSLPKRVEIVNLLLEEKRLNMGQIAEAIGMERSLLTHHVTALESAGLVTRTKDPVGNNNGNAPLCYVWVELVIAGNQEVLAQMHAAFSMAQLHRQFAGNIRMRDRMAREPYGLSEMERVLNCGQP
jgi:DNA-binding transcriptional ArsR family regulator